MCKWYGLNAIISDGVFLLKSCHEVCFDSSIIDSNPLIAALRLVFLSLFLESVLEAVSILSHQNEISAF